MRFEDSIVPERCGIARRLACATPAFSAEKWKPIDGDPPVIDYIRGFYVLPFDYGKFMALRLQSRQQLSGEVFYATDTGPKGFRPKENSHIVKHYAACMAQCPG
jgi:hypothetical protein